MSCFFPGSLFPRPVIHAKQFSRERPYCGPSHADRANSNKKNTFLSFLTINCEHHIHLFVSLIRTCLIYPSIVVPPDLCLFPIETLSIEFIMKLYFHPIMLPYFNILFGFSCDNAMEKNEMLFYISHFDIALWGHISTLSIS